MRAWSDRFFEFRASITHELRAMGPHGVHSPFVFDILVNYCPSSFDIEVLKVLRDLHKELRRDSTVIVKVDYGTGESGPIKVSTIANRSIKSFKQSIFISWLAKHVNSTRILELGSCLGTTTAALAAINPEAEINSVEGCSNTARIASDNLRKLGLQNAKIIQYEMSEYFHSLPKCALNQFDFIILDCNHTYSATLEYFLQIESSSNENLVIVCDDIHWSAEMNRAWKFMSQRPTFEISIDFLHFGILARRKGKEKEHFVLKMP